MHSEPIDILIARILNTYPYQLPPIVHSSGCYTLDIDYLGHSLQVVAVSLQECLSRYFEHVTMSNYLHRKRNEPLADAPVKPGSFIPKP